MINLKQKENTMCVLWMPANLISSGIVDKNDKIFKKENKNAKQDEEQTKQRTDSKIDDRAETK